MPYPPAICIDNISVVPQALYFVTLSLTVVEEKFVQKSSIVERTAVAGALSSERNEIDLYSISM